MTTTIAPTTAAPTTSPAPTSRRERLLRLTLLVVAAFQLALGALFLLAPRPAAELFALPPAPEWTSWLFAMMAARFLGYGVGMVLAARDPRRHLAWIDTMAAIQLVDWLATVGYLAAGDVVLRNVATASFMPLVFAVALLVLRPRRRECGSAAAG